VPVSVLHPIKPTLLIQVQVILNEQILAKGERDILLDPKMLHELLVELGEVFLNPAEECLAKDPCQFRHRLATHEGVKLLLLPLEPLINSIDEHVPIEVACREGPLYRPLFLQVREATNSAVCERPS